MNSMVYVFSVMMQRVDLKLRQKSEEATQEATVRQVEANGKTSQQTTEPSSAERKTRGSHNPTNFEEVTSKLEAAAADAVTVLHAALFDSSASTRIRAAVAILNFGMISEESRDLDSRLAQLERLRWKKTKF